MARKEVKAKDTYRPIVTVLAAKNGVATKIQVSGKIYVIDPDNRSNVNQMIQEAHRRINQILRRKRRDLVLTADHLDVKHQWIRTMISLNPFIEETIQFVERQMNLTLSKDSHMHIIKNFLRKSYKFKKNQIGGDNHGKQ